MAHETDLRGVHHEIAANRQINITPLIDVVFQLLIFFMVASSLVRPNRIELNLPESTSGVKAAESPGMAITYRVTAGGLTEITLDAEPVDNLEGLRTRMRGRIGSTDETQPPVDIHIDRAVPYQDVIAVMDAVRDAGFPRFSLQTLAPGSGVHNPSAL